MKYLLGLMIAVLSVSALANENPLIKKIECAVQDCNLLCMNTANQWMKIEEGAKTIIVSYYDNGNTEFLLKRGVSGDKIVLIGPNNLQCKIDGIQ
ncbi:hypothetical protein [Shewanella sp. SM23]|uniref:hypothetical protein n=1 Tax=Shewanella sp. SM23 TaxID=2912794 RepID=UPI0021D83A89|nr:hypothetical protein [Shewanella sp. SM23]MCU8085356.1 hypothetical protein [Shewanella sp. SM23]